MNSFNEIIGYEYLKREMMMVCDAIKNPKKYLKFGVSIPRGILFFGVPGVGKSLMAAAIAKESGRKVFTIRKSRPDGEFVNYIRETFEQAQKEAPSVIILDDMDKFANSDNNHPDAEEYVTVQACIDEVKNSQVFIVATVNDRYALPESLIRPGRFDRQIEMRTPEGDEAVEIISHYLSEKTVHDDVDAKEIARILNGRSCAELESIVNEAGIFAAYEGRELVSRNDIIKVCLKKIFHTGDKVDYEDKDRLRTIAIHEAGHAVLAEILDPGSVNLISIADGRDDVGGVTSIDKPKGYWYSKEMMEHRVISILGGRAATDVVCGVIDVGCSSDINRAFNIVGRFIGDYCTFGFDAHVTHNSSQSTLENLDTTKKIEMERYYWIAKKMLIDNRAFLDAVVQALMERMTLTGKEIEEIKEQVYA